jgi:hypothetical protein
MPLNGDEVKDTNTVAAEVIAEIESGGSDENVREITETQPEKKAEGGEIESVKKDEKKSEEKKPEAKAEEKKADEDDDDFEKVPAEIDDPKAKGKKIENRLPHSRVKKMTERAAKKAREAADAEWKAKHEPVEQTLQQVLTEIRRLDELMKTDGDAFLAEIGKAHPMYKEYKRQIAAAEKAATEDPEPQPDVPNEKGEMVGYSIAQAKKLMSWTARQEVKGVRDEIKPVRETVETAQRTAAERARQQQQDEADLQYAQREYETAEKNWPGFTEHKAEIEAAFMANKNFRLHDAYMAVVVPKLQKAAADARTSVLEEMKKEPVTSTVVAGGTAERAPETSRPLTTEEIAREEMRKAGLL